MNIKCLFAVIALIAIVNAEAKISISNVVCRQQYPWNGKVDIDYELFGDVDDTNIWITATGLNKETNQKITLTPLTGDGINRSTKPGKHHLIWNAEKKYHNLVTKQFTVVLQARKITKLYYEDFEDYRVGTQMSEQKGWDFFTPYSGNTTVVTNAPNIDGKAMLLSQSANGSDENVMVLTPSFDMTTPNPVANLVNVSTRVVVGSTQDIFALYDKNNSRYFYLKFDRDSGTLESNPSGISFNNLYTDAATPNEISFTWDPFFKKVSKVVCNGQEKECDIDALVDCEQPSRLRLSTQLFSLGGAKGSYYDFVEVSYSPRSSVPMLLCVNDALIPLDAGSSEFTIYNAGPTTDTINYSVFSDSDWLEITPSSGSFNVSQNISLKAKEGLEEGFYRCNMTIDGGAAGSKVVSVMCSEGNIIFEEKFDDMEDGNIAGQRGWTVDVGNVLVSKAYDCSGKCMYMSYCGGSYACSMYLPKPWYENIIVKVSYDLYWPGDSQCNDAYILMKDNGENEKFEAQFATVYPDGLGLKMIKRTNADGSEQEVFIKDFPLSPFDTWLKVEYVMDLRSQKLLSFALGENVTNFVDWPLMNQGCDFFNSWGHSAWSGWDNGSRVAVDNLKIERVPRGSDAKLVFVKYDSFGTNDTITIPITNSGTGSFEYKAEALDQAGALTITNPVGTVEDSVDLVINIDRTTLEDNFYRARVRVDAGEAGCATGIISFVCGNVYFFADFEEPFYHLGDLIDQDEWLSDIYENVAYVISTNDQRCLYVEYSGGWGGYSHPIEVPKNSLMRFDMDFFVTPSFFEDSELMNAPICYFKQKSKYYPSLEMEICGKVIDGESVVYGRIPATGRTISTTKYAGEWMHVTYVLDYSQGQLVEFTIDNNSEFPTDQYMNDSDCGCEKIFICVSKGANLSIDNVKISVVQKQQH